MSCQLETGESSGETHWVTGKALLQASSFWAIANNYKTCVWQREQFGHSMDLLLGSESANKPNDLVMGGSDARPDGLGLDIVHVLWRKQV
jgi:hypothetical protein